LKDDKKLKSEENNALRNPTLDGMPNDIVYEIFSHLEPNELLTKAAILNKRFAWIVRFDPCFWRSFAAKKSKELDMPIVQATKTFFRRNKCTSDLLEYWKSLSLYSHHEVMSNPYLSDTNEPMRKVACIVRMRPVLPAEKSEPTVKYRIKKNKISLWVPGTSKDDDDVPHTFELSKIYGPHAPQEVVYRENVAFPILNSIMGLLTPTEHLPRPREADTANQQKASPQTLTFIAFGQPGTGKTYTLFGPKVNDRVSLRGSATHERERGIIPRVCNDIFSFLRKYKKGSSSCTCSPGGTAYPVVYIKVSMFEILDEQIWDLLEPSENPLQLSEDILEHKISVEGLSEQLIEKEDQIYEVLQSGLDQRSKWTQELGCIYVRIRICVGSDCDLSKQITLLFVEWKGHEEGPSSPPGTPTGLPFRRPTAKLSSFVFSNVVSTLVKSRKLKLHIPYRYSKTTRILQDSFGGSAKTTFFFTCSPLQKDWDITTSTLRSARRTYEIRHNNVGKSLCKFY